MGVSAETIKRTLTRLASMTTDHHNVPVIGPSNSIALVRFYTEDRLDKCKRTVSNVSQHSRLEFLTEFRNPTHPR